MTVPTAPGHHAVGLLLTDPDRGVVLRRRVTPGRADEWDALSGTRTDDVPTYPAVLRAAVEQAPVIPEHVGPNLAVVVDHDDRRYTLVIATLYRDDGMSPPQARDLRWVAFDEVAALPLSTGLAAAWPRVREHVGQRAAVVVDTANVVGSRPDGWWRDRAGAAERLRDRLASADGFPATALGLPADHWWPDVTMVVEGRARSVAAVDGVSVMSAQGSGDDTIVTVTGEIAAQRPTDPVIVVTADRELRRRVAAVGATVVGPRALLAASDG